MDFWNNSSEVVKFPPVLGGAAEALTQPGAHSHQPASIIHIITGLSEPISEVFSAFIFL